MKITPLTWVGLLLASLAMWGVLWTGSFLLSALGLPAWFIGGFWLTLMAAGMVGTWLAVRRLD